MTLLDLKKAPVVHAPEMASLAKSEGCLESSQALFVWSLANVENNVTVKLNEIAAGFNSHKDDLLPKTNFRTFLSGSNATLPQRRIELEAKINSLLKLLFSLLSHPLLSL